MLLLRICQNNSYNDKVHYFNEYHLGNWFSSLWSIVKNNSALMQDFIGLFEAIFIHNHQKIYLMSSHSNKVFFDILSHYYFGSHVTTNKLKQLFEHTFRMDCYYTSLDTLRSTMRLYQISTGYLPFPNAKNLSS